MVQRLVNVFVVVVVVVHLAAHVFDGGVGGVLLMSVVVEQASWPVCQKVIVREGALATIARFCIGG